ncbi:MAG: PHP domain-containing protein [Firmicutes bacterium]|nr:PHP domain-containing protein [Bacillota bacterium]
MLELYYDFHIHSCLSPCGSNDMTPQNIANMAALAGYEIIAVADHNCMRNCKGVMEAAEQVGILAVPAMELSTMEEVHILCLLPDLKAADEFDKYVYTKLPNIRNRKDIFGRQIYMDGQGQVLGEEEKLLISAADIEIYEVYDLVKSYGGTAIPAHVDRSSFSLVSNLGFYDPAMQFPAIELTEKCDCHAFEQTHRISLPHIFNSDAHRLDQIPDPKRKIRLKHLFAKEVIQTIEICRANPGNLM